ncbi:2,3-bisphosphoglycerate-dependent phosphoglycerate mutase [Maribacter sp. ACAM166]|uniref:2,3-bisphosphoglycerate-dependent phosphoglycerate mutase n=1 Tax=Maribacter sp. ACAM166 TaxID=2508996 RepID=UPI0010FE066E|nr:2,3-bisphosphoglycerate-dependent phosphoglycerate mutase [Maribacter sp. ACAM166]TLP81786.1 2,3-bisphosphoglycerate-dependent phosphoglycerate mutase [Maribacter sp. ACAM166]
MGNLILVRHGKSEWNVQNIFTGWTDVDLAPEGIEEAKKAGEIIKSNDIDIDICFSSYLKRAIRTAWIILDTAEQMHVDTRYHWKLNERHYGDWQGKNKDEVLKEVGEKTYWGIRRGYATPPPPLTLEDKRHPLYDSNYKALDENLLPNTESLQITQLRAVNYFYDAIVPQLARNKTVLVSAHGNSLRALMAHLEQIKHTDLPNIEVPTGIPFMYEFDDTLKLLGKQKLKKRAVELI